MPKQSWFFCAVCCLSPLSLAVLAATNPWNPDTIPMEIRAGNYGVRIGSNGITNTTVSYPQANTYFETETPIGDPFDQIGKKITKMAKNWCDQTFPNNTQQLDSTAGSISVASVSGPFHHADNAGVTYSGSVSCNWVVKTEFYNSYVQQGWATSGSITMDALPTTLYIGNCPSGYKPDPTNNYQHDALEQLRCIPKTNFSGANIGRSENNCSFESTIPRPENSGCTTSNPVHLGTGNKFLEEIDYTGSGIHPLKWVRYYNSQLHPISRRRGPEVSTNSIYRVAPLTAPLGAQWLHSYSAFLTMGIDTSGIWHVAVYRPTGRTYLFEKNTSEKWISSQGIVLDEKLISQTDVNSNITGWQWIQADETIESYDTNGRLTTITSREGIVTRLTYATSDGVYPTGAPVCILPAGSPVAPASSPVNALQCITDAQGRQINLQYNSNGQIQHVIDPLGKVTHYTYTPTQLLTTYAELDLNGMPSIYHQIQTLSLSQVKYPDQGGRHYLYTESGHVAPGTPPSAWLMTGIQENANTEGTSNWVRFSHYHYDLSFKVTQEYLAGNAEQYSFLYGSSDIPSVTGPDGNNVRNRFLNVVPTGNTGQIKMTTDALGGEYTYDAAGNAIKYNYPGNPKRSKSSTYDSQNRPIEILDYLSFNGTQDSTTQHRTITWHTTFRLPTKIVEDIPFSKADGSLVSQGQRVTQFTYDTQGRLTQKVIQSIDGSHQTEIERRTYQYTYDDTDGLGQLSTVKLVNNSTASTLQTLTYYALNSSTSKKADLKTIKNALNQVTTFDSYDATGRVLQTTDPNGVVTQLTYDSRGRLLTHTITGRTTTFTWDGIGQLKKIVRPDNSSLSYTYDAAHRLIQIQDTSGNLLRAAYDTSSRVIAMDKVTASNAIVWRKEWKYDSHNNVIEERNVKGAAPTISMQLFNPLSSSVAKADFFDSPEHYSPLDQILPFMGSIQKAEALLKGEQA